MMKLLGMIFSPLLGALSKALPFFLTYKAGKDAVKRDIAEKENEILQKQRDNNVTDVNDAISLHNDKNKQ